jgi:hypothetical protein
MKIKKINEDFEFEIGKKEVLMKLEKLIEAFEDFTNDIYPSSWNHLVMF